MILTLNAGSSSLKFALFASEGADPARRAHGQVEKLGPDARLILHVDGVGATEAEIGRADHAAALTAVFDALGALANRATIRGVGHRIAHGGLDFTAPARLDAAAEAKLKALAPLAPLHQPHNLAALSAARSAFPAAAQIGCFDTAFHRAHPWVNDVFAIPRRFYEAGVRRYGFHGLSYDFVSSWLAEAEPELAAGRVVIAHLGAGASMCGLSSGRSVASTMGFSALDGLPMGTRSGQIDPGVLLYLLDHEGLTATELTRLLYKESGLLGLSGVSHDMRTLLSSDAPEAAQAVDYYVFRVRREIGAMAAVLGGIDALAFCGGIGENAPVIRSRIVEGMEWLGLALDPDRNTANAASIEAGPVAVRVVRTDEERVIARAVAADLAAGH